MDGLTAGGYSVLALMFLVYFLVPFKNGKSQKQIQKEMEKENEKLQEIIIEPPQSIPFKQKKKQLNSWRTDGYEYIVPIPENTKTHPNFVDTTTEGALPYWVAFGLPERWKVANTTQWHTYKPFFYEPLPGDNVYYTVNDLLENRKNKLL